MADISVDVESEARKIQNKYSLHDLGEIMFNYYKTEQKIMDREVKIGKDYFESFVYARENTLPIIKRYYKIRYEKGDE